MNNSTLTIQRTFDATINSVWDAWAKPDEIIQWWAMPGVEIEAEKFDFTVNGRWEIVITLPGGKRVVTTGIYKEIEKYQTIITSYDSIPMLEDIILEVNFQECNNQTELTLDLFCINEACLSDQDKNDLLYSWESTFDELENYLVK